MKNTAVILFIILVNLIFTSNEVTATNSVLNPSIAELWVEIDGAIYGGPRPAGSSSLAMYNSNGELIKPNEKIAGRFLTAGYLYQDVKAKSYSALDETLDEVIFATSYAGLVNQAGTLAEDNLGRMGKTCAQSILAPATGGLSVANQIGAEIAKITDAMEIDIEKIKFIIGIGAVIETRLLIADYEKTRKKLMSNYLLNQPISYDAVIDAYNKMKIISDLGPFSAQMTLDSVTKGDEDQGFWANFFTGLANAFQRIVWDSIEDLISGSVKAVNGVMDVAENARQIGEAVAEIQLMIESIRSDRSQSMVASFEDMALSIGMATREPDPVNSSASNSLPQTPVLKTVDQPMVEWEASAGDVSGYIISCGPYQGYYPDLVDVGNVTAYSLDNFSLSEGEIYYFVVRAYNSHGESPDSNVISYMTADGNDTTPPLKPDGLTVKVSSNGVLLSWSDNTEKDLTNYRVYHGTSSRDYGLPIQVNETKYSITGLKSNTTYYFSVTALDKSGNESGYSSQEVVKTISSTASTAPPSAADTTAPMVTITSPTSGSSYNTKTDTVNISGSATDTTGVTSVSWSNSRGGSGTATGTKSWSIDGIALAKGGNLITVTATDEAGNASTDTLTVVYSKLINTSTEQTAASPTPPRPDPQVWVEGKTIDIIGQQISGCGKVVHIETITVPQGEYWKDLDIWIDGNSQDFVLLIGLDSKPSFKGDKYADYCATRKLVDDGAFKADFIFAFDGKRTTHKKWNVELSPGQKLYIALGSKYNESTFVDTIRIEKNQKSYQN